jgi:hypothetical protein
LPWEHQPCPSVYSLYSCREVTYEDIWNVRIFCYTLCDTGLKAITQPFFRRSCVSLYLMLPNFRAVRCQKRWHCHWISGCGCELTYVRTVRHVSLDRRKTIFFLASGFRYIWARFE